MAAFLPTSLGGFKHRLTKMYQDTKNLYDFTEPPKVSISSAPELSSLHRKLRIQKDRLIAWGLQWSDNPNSSSKGSGEKGDGGQPADIDESLDKAGLGDVVGSVLATIKEIIAEADPLWQSSRQVVGSGLSGGDEKLAGGLSRIASEKMAERRSSFVQWDQARFEGLVHDLTISIDTLYDISKNRQRPARPRTSDSMRKVSGAVELEAERERGRRTSQFESSRMQTPQVIDPKVLIIPGEAEGQGNVLKPGLVGEGGQGGETRRLVYMRRQHTANNPWKRDGGIPIVPVLLEYAPFDPIFASTGIAPPMDRFEKLFAGLQGSQNVSTSRQEFHVPKLIGYFEDWEGARFGLVYELPNRFGTADDLQLHGIKPPFISTLADLFRGSASPPALEIKFRLAYNLATTVFKLQAKDIVHGNVASDNVLFFHEGSWQPGGASQDYDVRQPFLTNFDLFSIAESGGLSSYREHVELAYSFDANIRESRTAMDLRGLALLLLEIGLWTPIGQAKTSPAEEKPRIAGMDLHASSEICTRLVAQCGTLYMKAVQSCWLAGNPDTIQSSQRDPSLQVKMYWQVVKALEKCCAIDDGFELDILDGEGVLLHAYAISRNRPAIEPTRNLRPASANTSDISTTESYKGSIRSSIPRSEPREMQPEDYHRITGVSKSEWSGTTEVDAVKNVTPVSEKEPGETFRSREQWSRLRTGLPKGEKSQEISIDANQARPNRGEKIGLYDPSLTPSRFYASIILSNSLILE